MTTLVLLRAELLPVRRSLRGGWGVRLRLLAALAFSILVAALLARSLFRAASGWEAAGPQVAAARVWVPLGLAWTTAGALSLLSVLEAAFGPQATLLFTLPLTPAARVRGLYATVVTRFGVAWPAALVAWSVGLGAAMGWAAAPWVVVMGLGAALVPWLVISLVASLTRLLASRRPAPALALLAVAAAGVVLAAVGLVGRVEPPHPLLVAAGLLAAHGIAAGPLSGVLGRLYSAGFYAGQGRGSHAGGRRWLAVPAAVLARGRSLTSALLVRSLFSRGRHWSTWLRLGVAAAAVAAFPAVRSALLERGLSPLAAVVVVACGVAWVTILDSATSPFGAEGNRLTLLLTAPLSHGAILRAKFAAFALPFVGGAVVVAAALALPGGLGPRDAALAALLSALAMAGVCAVVCWGSVWDIDLSMEVEGGLMGLMQEEAPLSPVRLALVAAGNLVLVAELVLLSRLAPVPALAAFALLTAALMGTSLALARARFSTLARAA